MTIFLKCISFALIGIGVASAQQPFVDIYTNVSVDSDVTTSYATGVMQVDMANSSYCSIHPYLCTGATHTYTQTVTIKSPSGRTGSCGFNSQYPAMTTVNLQCEAVLGFDGELGSYSVENLQRANCTIAGQFIYSVFSGGVSFEYSTTAYKNAGAVSGGSVYTYYPSDIGCQCSCRGANDITRPGAAEFWETVLYFTKLNGVLACEPRFLGGAGNPSSNPVSCGDTSFGIGGLTGK